MAVPGLGRCISLAGAVLLAASVFLTACGGKEPVLKPDPDFSVNVMAVPEWWPREELDWPEDAARRQVEQDAWARYGTPEFLRFVYTVDRRIVKPSESLEGHRMAGTQGKPDIEWIYVNDEIILSFNKGKAVERPLDDRLRTVVLYGDPNEIKRWPELGVERTSFTYYDHGKTFSFAGDKLMDTYDFKPMPGFNMRD